MPRDIPGVWPMVRHYFLFGKKPPVVAAYNPLQKLAYTSTVFFGAVSFLSGLVMYKPVQFWWLTWMLGGFRLARVWHFMAMCGFVAFIPGHLIMVAAAWLEQLLLHDYRLEARSRVSRIKGAFTTETRRARKK